MQVTFTYLLSLVNISLYSLTAYKTPINHAAPLPPVFPPWLRQHQLAIWNKKRQLSGPPGAHALATPSTAGTVHKTKTPVHKPLMQCRRFNRDVYGD